MIGWIIFFLYVELYSVGMAIFLKKRGMRNYLLALIPFASFFFADRATGGFNAMSVRITSWGKLTIRLTVITLCAYLYGLWGMNHLEERNIEPLIQIMWLPAGVCMFVFWLCLVSSTLHLLFRLRSRFKFDWLCCFLLIPIPVLLATAKDNSEKYGLEKFSMA